MHTHTSYCVNCTVLSAQGLHRPRWHLSANGTSAVCGGVLGGWLAPAGTIPTNAHVCRLCLTAIGMPTHKQTLRALAQQQRT